MILYYEETAEPEVLSSLLACPDLTAAEAGTVPSDTELHLYLDGEGLSLRQGKLAMRGDFREMLPRLKQSNLEREMLVKASRMKNAAGPLALLDATAGMGEDSMILASAGFQVVLYEYDPVIAALLGDALRRAREIPELAAAASRMELHTGDSVAAMRSLSEAPDVILLDPMFPARNKSAMIKKKFQLLQQLESPCSNEEEMLMAAVQANPKKIVIKRPLKGPWLAGIRPDHSLSGKAIRYDCLVNLGTRKDLLLMNMHKHA